MSNLLWAASETGVDPASGLTGALLALVTLTAMEIVLGIDNVIFIAVLAGRLPKEQQPGARRMGLMIALITRLALLGLLFFLSGMEAPLFSWPDLGIPADWFQPHRELKEGIEVVTYPGRDVSIKDLVLLLGGAFLIYKSTMEIHHKLEGEEEGAHAAGGGVSYTTLLAQIAVMDIIFSLDSVITAVGMARQIWVMVVAMIVALGVMLLFADAISNFVARHPTVKMLALAFLILIGVMLVVEGFGQHISKNYIYFAMAFSLAVEMLNLRMKTKAGAVKLHEKQMPRELQGEPPA
jgi:predicted tellurium resistance membrane protein TerC